jgi:Ca2+-binding RTX toxin-like protein
MNGGAGNDILVDDGGAHALNDNGGKDVFIGGGGQDTLTGGSGTDIFLYTSQSDGGGGTGDSIVNFTSGTDLIEILGAAFGGLAPTDNLSATQFGTSATNTFAAGEVFHFDTANRTLYYNNAGTAVALAHVDSGHTIAATDIHVV